MQAKLKPGTFPDGAVVTINRVAPGDLPVQLTPEDRQYFTLDGGITLDFGGAQPQQYIDISMEPVGGETTATRWLVTQVIDLDGQKIMAIVDTGKFRNNRITTASPPCPGVQAAGTFGLIRSQQSVGVSYARVYTGYGGALMFGLGYYIVAGLYQSPFAVFADRFADALCFPAFSASVTLTQNTTQAVVPGANLAPADRVLKFRNLKNAALGSVALGRDVLEPLIDVVGEDKHSFRIVAKGTNTATGIASEQLVTRFTVTTLEPVRVPFLGKVRVRMDPDPITIAVTEYVVTNLSLKQETVLAVTPPEFKGKVPGGDDENYEVKIVDVLGRERTLGTAIKSVGSPFGVGNLVFHAEPGSNRSDAGGTRPCGPRGTGAHVPPAVEPDEGGRDPERPDRQRRRGLLVRRRPEPRVDAHGQVQTSAPTSP